MLLAFRCLSIKSANKPTPLYSNVVGGVVVGETVPVRVSREDSASLKCSRLSVRACVVVDTKALVKLKLDTSNQRLPPESC